MSAQYVDMVTAVSGKQLVLPRLSAQSCSVLNLDQGCNFRCKSIPCTRNGPSAGCGNTPCPDSWSRPRFYRVEGVEWGAPGVACSTFTRSKQSVCKCGFPSSVVIPQGSYRPQRLELQTAGHELVSCQQICYLARPASLHCNACQVLSSRNSGPDTRQIEGGMVAAGPCGSSCCKRS